MGDSRLFSLEEAARELGGISVWLLRKHQYQGSLRVIRIGKRILIAGEELSRIKAQGLPSLRSRTSSATGTKRKTKSRQAN